MVTNATSENKKRLPFDAQFAALLEHWPGVLFWQRTDFTLDWISPLIEQWTGLPVSAWQQPPEKFWRTVHEPDAPALRKHTEACIRSAQGLTHTFRFCHAQTGRLTCVSEFRRALLDPSGALQGYEGFWIDVTRQQIAQEKLTDAAWKEALASVTTGLAHDTNNCLTGILSMSDTILSQIDPQQPFHESLTLIKESAQKAAGLIQRLMELHHAKTGFRTYHDLNAATTETVELLRKVIRKRIDLALQLEPTPLPVFVDGVELRRAITHLGLSAAGSIGEQGKILFQTTRARKLPLMSRVQGQPPRQPCVCLSIGHNGSGLAAAQLDSVFDPFFVTNSMKSGVDWGLYAVKLFAQEHQGAVSVESAEGEGTTFRLWLPQADLTEAEPAQSFDL